MILKHPFSLSFRGAAVPYWTVRAPAEEESSKSFVSKARFHAFQWPSRKAVNSVEETIRMTTITKVFPNHRAVSRRLKINEQGALTTKLGRSSPWDRNIEMTSGIITADLILYVQDILPLHELR